jgi:sortase A
MQQTLWQWLLAQKTLLLSVGLILIMIIYGIIRLIRDRKKDSRKKKEEAD